MHANPQQNECSFNIINSNRVLEILQTGEERGVSPAVVFFPCFCMSSHGIKGSGCLCSGAKGTTVAFLNLSFFFFFTHLGHLVVSKEEISN